MNKITLDIMDVLSLIGIIFMKDGGIIVKLKVAMETKFILFALWHNSKRKGK